jgi:formylglycine-generating enzyme required for sulfatase activity
MRRWFLSYNSQDLALMQAFEAALRRKDAEAHIFFAPKSLRAGGFWLPELAKEIAEATAFVLLVGEKGVGPWQIAEYYEAVDRRVKEQNFPVIPLLLQGQSAPGLPFLRQLHWIITPDPASEQSLAKLMDAATGGGARPSELWRYAAPYRGLVAMTEADSDFFFGRTRETVEIIRALEAKPDKLPILLGNSGVGKSSVAQAGVIGALARQGWPDDAVEAGPWPPAFANSRQWCFLTVRPGAEPVKALVDSFIRTWRYDATDPAWEERRSGWIERLIARKATLPGLLDATERRHEELGQPKPPAFFLYLDQGEELYVRAEERQGRRFSEVLAQGVGDPRLRAMMSMRTDFFGHLQKDEPLYEAHQQINVPPLREAQLNEIVSMPADLLGARFESETLAGDIASRTANESTKDAGALPLLSYLLDDMWRSMVERGDGVLRLPAQAIDLGRVLVDRANAFISRHPNFEDMLRRIFTLKLATVREDGEPTRRRAWRSEFTDNEWRLVTELTDHPNRLLVTATPEGGETYAEVAHEAIFRRWDKLKEWIAAEREFLAWKTGLEAARNAWENAPEGSKSDALLMGFALTQALRKSAPRRNDIPRIDLGFIELSHKIALRRKLRVQALVGGLAVVMAAVLAAWRYENDLKERLYWLTDVRGQALPAAAERALEPGNSFKECTKCPEMLVVREGELLMGSPDDESGHDKNEGAQHKVVFKNRFAVAEFELTFEEWDTCVDHGDCDPHISTSGWGRGRQPAINVSWDDAKRYVEWLSRITGRTYRLLSEAEWEYAARAGSQTAYPWGNEVGKGHANCNGCGSEWDNKHTAPVGQFPANKFGLHDMHGNVWEWVEDCYHDNYDSPEMPTDGSAWTTGDCSFHVVRGGSWFHGPEELRSAQRFRYITVMRNDVLGIRVGRRLLPP